MCRLDAMFFLHRKTEIEIRGPAINFALTYPADCYGTFVVTPVALGCHSMTFS